MTDDLDDLRRRNAEMLKGRRTWRERIHDLREAERGAERDRLLAAIDAAQRKAAQNVRTVIVGDETPRRCAADFWNG